MFVKFLFSQKKHCFIIFPYNVEIDFLIHYGLVTCLNYQKYCPIIRTPRPFFMLFSSIFPLRAAPSSMVLGRSFAKSREQCFFVQKTTIRSLVAHPQSPRTALPAGYALLTNRFILLLDISSEMKKEGKP